jgi:outer membrane protein assembly factor BamE (lipoprotein component of BamABCDE complex)
VTALFRIGVAVALAASVAGCVTASSTVPSAVVTSVRTKVIAADRVKEVIIGKSTRADVIASLGETLVISFDNGFEVWVYRLAQDKRAEFVILFAPSGHAAKTRIRPPPQPWHEG